MSKKETQNNNDKYIKEAAALFASIFVDLLDMKDELEAHPEASGQPILNKNS